VFDVAVYGFLFLVYGCLDTIILSLFYLRREPETAKGAKFAQRAQRNTVFLLCEPLRSLRLN
jgi:hypothetical protein